MKTIYKQRRKRTSKRSSSKTSKRSTYKKGASKRSTYKKGSSKRSTSYKKGASKRSTYKKGANKRSTYKKQSKYTNKRMRGGGCCGPNNFETGGTPWGPSRWPAVTPGPHDGSYYPLNMNAIDPPMPVNQLQRGGGYLTSFIPSDIMTASRGLVEGVKGHYYGWKGLTRPDSSYPSPTIQPSLEREQARNIPVPIDIESIHLDAGKNSI